MSGRLAALTALLGVLILIVSQFVTAYSLENELDEVLETVSLIEKHGVVTTLLALVAGLALVFAVVTGSRSGLIVMIGMGVAAILIFLIVDLPDIGDTGMFNTETAGNLDATGKAAPGIWLELLGGVVLVLAGLALLTLNEAQLRSIGDRISASRRDSKDSSHATSPSREAGDPSGKAANPPETASGPDSPGKATGPDSPGKANGPDRPGNVAGSPKED